MKRTLKESTLLVSEDWEKRYGELSWDGPFALEIQVPFTGLVFSGRKTVETRKYPLPRSLVDRKIWVLETPESDGSALGPEIDQTTNARIVGEVRFKDCLEYRTQQDWDAARPLHAVERGSTYDWNGEAIYGWTISECHPYAHPKRAPPMARHFRSLFLLSPAFIPTIDIGPFLQGTPEEQRAVVQQFKDTSHVFGFFRIRCGNVLGPEEVADTHRVFSEFFGMEEEKKAAVSKGAIKKANDSFTSTGYRPGTGGINNKGRESYSCSVPYYKPGDPLYSDTYYTSDEGKKYFAVAPDPQVVWPAKELIPNFQDQVTQYYKKVEMIGKLLFRIFALVLDVEEERFLPMADKHISSMNAFHFTGKTCNDILEAHADITCFTIISYDHSPGAEGSQCLEILTPDKLWVPVKSMPGTFLLNIGQIMERWSNGRLKATLHRVIQPKFLPPGSRRQCIVFFQSTNYNTVLDVLPEFAPADPTTSKYSPERMDQYSLTRLSLFYKEGVSDEEAWYNYNKDVMDKQDYYTLKYI